jgi:CheY-like chemotaxis protein
MKSNQEFTPISTPINILIAEDDDTDRLLFDEALEELPVNASLTAVVNGEELMQWLSDENNELPDVLFLDLNMPRKNGFAALGQIKRDPRLEELPVFIFSTANDEEMIKQVYKDAAHYFIRKPGKFRELKSLIYKALTLVADKNPDLPVKEDFILTNE